MTDLLKTGIENFNSGNFFDAHDLLEELWDEKYGNEKKFLNGLIHCAVGCYHLEGGNFAGARGQLSKAIEKLKDFEEGYLNVDFKQFFNFASHFSGDRSAETGNWRDRILSGTFPKLGYHATHSA